MLSSAQVELVTRSFALVEPNASQATALFCRRLAQVAPETRSLFGDDPGCHADELANVLRSLVERLGDPSALRDAAAELADRCADGGVHREHLAAMGDAAIWTLATGLGHRFTPVHREAWQAAFDTVAAAVLDATALSAR